MKGLLTLLLLCAVTTLAFAQTGAPKKFNYQAVPRKADGTLLAANTAVKIQFAITEDGPTTVRYAEEHLVTVSQHGVVSAIVGDGVVSGTLPFDFEVLDWKNHSYYLVVAVDLNGDGLFDNTEQFASSQLLSVPYALYAEQSGNGTAYNWGTGLAIDVSTSTISNTGDLNSNDDVLKTSVFANGDVTGTFNDGLEIKPNAVTGAEIANQSIQKEDLANMGATNGQVLKWNGTTWAPAVDATGTPGTGDNWGTQTAVTTLPISGDGTSGSPLTLATNSVNSSHITNGSVTSADLAAGTLPTVTAGSGISLTPTANGYTINNSAPDQPIVLSGSGITTVSGSYPNFTINTPNSGSGISGSGNSGYLPKFSSTTALNNSIIYQSGNNVGIGTTSPSGNLDINGGELALHNGSSAFNVALRSDGKLAFEANGSTGDNTLVLHNSNSRVSIGTSEPPPGANERLSVSGNIRTEGIFFSGTGGFYSGINNSINTSGGIVPITDGSYFVGRYDQRWAAGYLNKVHSSEYVIAGTTSGDDMGASLRVVGAENNGSNAAMRIESGSQTLTLDGNEIDAETDGLYLNNNSSTNVVLVAGGGKVNIGDGGSLTGLLNVQGTAYKTGGGSWSSFSDRRLKEQIAPFSAGLDVLSQINPVTFHYNGKLGMSNVPEYVGVIAQDLQVAAPFMVTETPITEGPEAGQTYLSVDPSAFTYVLINAVKSQQAEIDHLKNQLEAQQAQINALLAGFEKLKAEVTKTPE